MLSAGWFPIKSLMYDLIVDLYDNKLKPCELCEIYQQFYILQELKYNIVEMDVPAKWMVTDFAIVILDVIVTLDLLK